MSWGVLVPTSFHLVPTWSPLLSIWSPLLSIWSPAGPSKSPFGPHFFPLGVLGASWDALGAFLKGFPFRVVEEHLRKKGTLHPEDRLASVLQRMFGDTSERSRAVIFVYQHRRPTGSSLNVSRPCMVSTTLLCAGNCFWPTFTSLLLGLCNQPTMNVSSSGMTHPRKM